MGKRKHPDNDTSVQGSSSNLNQDICNFLTELSEYEKNVSRNIHKYNAYRKASSVLAKHPTKIKSRDEARQLEGIGDKISKKIQEFLDTGKLQKLEKIRADDSAIAINEMTRITGIGPAKARELYNEGIKSIDDLKNNKEKLNHHQLIGLRHFEDFEKRIPRVEISQIENELGRIIETVDEDYILTICGSYRRDLPTSGDVDGLITHQSLKKASLKAIVDALLKNGFVTDTLSLGSTKFMGVCRLKDSLPFRRVDLRLLSKEHYPCGILYFTGSDAFNRRMRTHALDRGFMLNEYSLRPVGATGVPGEPLNLETEEEIFDYIEFEYKEPKDRSE